MNDGECLEIERSAVGYLLRCGFDDLAITVYETSNALQHLRKELQRIWLKTSFELVV